MFDINYERKMTFVVVVLKAVNDSVLTKSTLRHSKYGEFDSSTVFGRSEKGRLKSNSTVECVVRSLFAETVGPCYFYEIL